MSDAYEHRAAWLLKCEELADCQRVLDDALLKSAEIEATTRKEVEAETVEAVAAFLDRESERLGDESEEEESDGKAEAADAVMLAAGRVRRGEWQKDTK